MISLWIMFILVLFNEYQLAGDAFSFSNKVTYGVLSMYILLILMFSSGLGLFLKKRLVINKPLVLWLVLVVYCAVTCMWAKYKVEGFLSLRFITFFIFIYFLMINFIRNTETLTSWSNFFIGLAFISWVHALYYQLVLGDLRVWGIDVNPNFYSAFCLVSIPFMIRKISATKSHLFKIILASMIVINVAVIFLCKSRMSLVALLFLLGVLFFRKEVSLMKKFLVLCIFITILFIIQSMVKERGMLEDRYSFTKTQIEDVLMRTDKTGKGRVLLLSAELLKKPIVWMHGIGYSNFKYFYLNKFNKGELDPHNILLKFLIETGLLGFFLISYIIILPFINIAKAKAKCSDIILISFCDDVQLSFSLFILNSLSKPMIENFLLYVFSALSYTCYRVANLHHNGCGQLSYRSSTD